MKLKTDYKNAIFSGSRRYHMVENEDGTISLIDATRYTQNGDKFGAKDVNGIGTAVNGLADSMGDAFLEEKVYTAGSYAIYENMLYKFTAEKAEGPWDPGVVEPVTIAGVLRELNGNLTTFSNDLDDVSKSVAQKAGKTANSYTGTQAVRKTVGITAATFKTAQFFSRNGNNSSSRACYGFENEGVNGGALYLDTDGRLKFVDNTGVVHTLSWQ